MLKKLFYSAAICLSLLLSVSQNSFAQAKTLDELKAEREAFKSEMKSSDAQKRQEKIVKMSTESPFVCEISSLDGLASNSQQILLATKSINLQIPELYKRTIGETIDGVTDVTVKKPTLNELTEFAGTILQQVEAVKNAAEGMKGAADEVKQASMLSKAKAVKTMNFTKDALALTGPELQLSLKVINNLVSTLKSSNNN
jgi:hypothetical protein